MKISSKRVFVLFLTLVCLITSLTLFNINYNFTAYLLDYKSNSEPPGVSSCGHGDRIAGTSFAGRSPSVGRNGMAASSQPLVTQTALKILKNGGSAVDAAIAANIMQTLVEPMSNGIGGDMMSIIYNPSDKKLYGYNGSGRSSSNFSYDDMLSICNKQFNSSYIPAFGPLAITVPGALQGWCDIHNKFGVLPWNVLFEDAINYAENGFIITQIIGAYWESDVNSYKNHYNEITTNNMYPNAYNGFIDIYTMNGTSYKYGDLFVNSKLAEVYKTIANEGCDAFYRGSLTDEIVEFLNSVGSYLTKDDFVNHRGQWIKPVNTTYRKKYLVSELPPNPQGIATLQMLNMMELYPFGNDNSSYNLHSTDYLHYSVEIKKLVFADRAKYYADSNYSSDICIPVDQLISKQYAIERNKLINPSSAAKYCAPGNLTCSNNTYIQPIDKYSGDTIYLTVSDKNGMMVSWIQSNYMGFGSGIVSSNLGFAFQNRGSLFSLVKDSNNQYNLSKRPFHTIIPSFIHILNESNNEWIPFMSFGVMGGNIQPQGQVQIVSNMVDFGLNIQEAGDAARWVHDGSQQPTGEPMDTNGGYVYIESGICQNTANSLINRGHIVNYGSNGGGYQAIMKDPNTGFYYGATEMRKDGVALGY